MTRKSKHTTVFTSAKSILFISAISLFFACNSDSMHSESSFEDVKETGAKSAAPANVAKPPEEGLTNETAPEFLKRYGRENPEDVVIIETEFGDIRLRLYQNTPMHRANFIYLVKEAYFNGTWFYRVSPGHVIQAGNNDDSQTGKKRRRIGDFKIPNEIKAGNLHKRGALAAARTYYQNPDKKSNPYEFYIVLGKTYTPRELELLAEKEGFGLTEKQKKLYSQVPGSPHLDEEHTVFGEVIDGMEVVEAISKVKIDKGEWPLENIPIRVAVVE